MSSSSPCSSPTGRRPHGAPAEPLAVAREPALLQAAALAAPGPLAIADLPSGVPLAVAPSAPVQSCPLAAAAVAAGFPSPADDYVESRIDLNLELIPHPLATFFMRVSGNAMAADGILDGDLLVIDRSVPARPGLVVVATHAGAFIVRRLERPRGGALPGPQLVASDGVSAPIPLGTGEAEIWGVVIHAVHHLAHAPSRRR